jgi:AcrR family transcriptional regulator
MANKGERRHQALLEAALDAFSRYGFEGATTKSIAQATGATEAVLFQHFPTKRALFLAVLEQFGPRVPFGDWMAAGRDLPAPEALRVIATRYLDICWEHRQWLQVVQSAVAEDDDAAAALRRQNQGMGEPLLALIQQWSQRGEVPPELVEPLRNVIWLSARGFVDWVGRTPPRRWEVVRDRFVESLVAVCFRPPGQPERAQPEPGLPRTHGEPPRGSHGG